MFQNVHTEMAHTENCVVSLRLIWVAQCQGTRPSEFCVRTSTSAKAVPRADIRCVHSADLWRGHFQRALACDQLSFGCGITPPWPWKSSSNETLPTKVIGNMISPPTLPIKVIFVLRLANSLTTSGVGASPKPMFILLGWIGSGKSQSYSLFA